MLNNVARIKEQGERTQSKSLSDCHRDAVLLDGLLEAIGFIENERHCVNGLTALIVIGSQRSLQLAEDLDFLEMASHKKDAAA